MIMKTTSNKLKRIVPVLILGLTILQSGCHEGPITLDGTVWKGKTWVTNSVSTLTFQEGDFTITDTDLSSGEETSVTGTYIYDNPKVSLYAPGLTVDAEISGRTMTITGYSISGGGVDVADSYTKQ